MPTLTARQFRDLLDDLEPLWPLVITLTRKLFTEIAANVVT